VRWPACRACQIDRVDFGLFEVTRDGVAVEGLAQLGGSHVARRRHLPLRSGGTPRGCVAVQTRHGTRGRGG